MIMQKKLFYKKWWDGGFFDFLLIDELQYFFLKPSGIRNDLMSI